MTTDISARQPRNSAAPQPKTPILRFWYTPLLLDHLLRWMVWGLWHNGWIGTWLFVLLHMCVFFFVFGLFIEPRERRVKKIYAVDQLSVQMTPFSIGVGWAVAIVGVYMTYDVFSDWNSLFKIPTVGLLGYLYVAVVVGICTNSFGLQAPRANQNRFPQLPSAEDESDRNDLQIAAMDSEVSSVSQRIEAYTLESTLFGALAFSGFLTIASADRPILESVELLSSRVGVVGTAIANGSVGRISFDQNETLALIAIETLLCSTFFVAVVLSRLRYYNMLRRVQYAVQTARAWNDKEEAITTATLQDPSNRDLMARRETLSLQVQVAVQHAEPLLADLNAIVRYVMMFRSLGVFAFVIILITSASMISAGLAALLLVITLASVGYSSFDDYLRHRKLRDVPFFQRFSHRAR